MALTVTFIKPFETIAIAIAISIVSPSVFATYNTVADDGQRSYPATTSVILFYLLCVFVTASVQLLQCLGIEFLVRCLG